MRRTILLLCALALGSDSPKEYDDKTERDELQGEWRLVVFESPVQVIYIKDADPDMLIFRASKWHRSSVITSEAGTYTADAARKPAHLDRTHTAGEHKWKTERIIYRIDGDTLWTAERYDESSRPSSFEEKRLWIRTYQRVK